ncbi:MAG: extracellular solute-binding protein [Nitrospirae bacterium]|nr:extracellular solute-binding protein [Nitrospirota bacterium]
MRTFNLFRVFTLMVLLLLAVPYSPAKADFEADWKALIEAARKDGKVVLNSVPGAKMRKELPRAFKKKFGVELEFVTARTRAASQRAIREAKAGVLSTDLISGGQSTLARVLYPKGMLAPIKPLLIHPDINKSSVWLRGKPWFIDDKDEYLLRVIDLVVPIGAVNANIVDVSEFKSAKALLDPKWKGKIALYEPTRPGPGSNTISYLMKMFGEEYVVNPIRGQEVMRSRNRRQLADWLVQGKYPIVLALSITEATRLRADGFNIKFILPDDILPLEGPASGVFVLLKNSPHPNAAALFLNWITTKEGMQLYIDLEGAPGTRIDLDTSRLLIQEVIPKPGKKYFDSADWTYMKTESRKLFKRIKELFKQ